jgi:predicted Rossmann fold nucleotide-binding protein DprA/Smf involved in DNA uptake
MTQESHKDALKALRESRKQTIAAARERMKDTRKLRKQLTDILKDGPATVPELAERTGISSPDVLWHMTSMRKYGKVAEGEQSGDYFTYLLVKE